VIMIFDLIHRVVRRLVLLRRSLALPLSTRQQSPSGAKVSPEPTRDLNRSLQSQRGQLYQSRTIHIARWVIIPYYCTDENDGGIR